MQRIPECLEGIAGHIAEREPIRAAHLLGAATTIGEAVRVLFPPVHRQAYERDVAAVRTRRGCLRVGLGGRMGDDAGAGDRRGIS